jgi:hypothetical protein
VHVTPDASPGEVDPHRLMRDHYRLLARRLAVRVGIFGFLLVLPLILANLGAPNTFWSTVSAFPGVIGLGFTLLNFAGHPFRLRKCQRILQQYSLAAGSVTQPSKTTNSHNKTFFTVDVTCRDGETGRAMLAVEPQGLSRWPRGTEGGIWFAGDLPFGGVIVVPASNALLLARPERWDDAGVERNAASPSRIERAKKAGIELIPF